MLWGLYRPHDVPAKPDPGQLQEFYRSFSTETEIFNSRNGLPRLDVSLVEVARLPPDRTDVKTDLRNVPSVCLEVMRVTCARYGFTKWLPDLDQTAYELYNCACRTIFLDSFRQALQLGAWTLVSPNLKYFDHISLLLRIYDHYVHYLQLRRYRRERNDVGRAAQDRNYNNICRRRARVRQGRPSHHAA